MPKRKRGTEKTYGKCFEKRFIVGLTFSAHLAQKPSDRPVLRKSARLERNSHQLVPVPKGKKQRRENERCRALSSPSTTGSIREDVSRDHSVLLIAYLPEQRCPTQLFENTTEQSTDKTSLENHFGKLHSTPVGLDAGRKRKHEKEQSQTDIGSRKRTRKGAPAAASPNLDFRERPDLPGDYLSKKQKAQSEEAVCETSVLTVESLEKPVKELGAQKTEQEEGHDPITYWVTHHTWPETFAKYTPMASSNSTNKRPRTSDFSQTGKDERSRSYSQNRKDGEVPEQYTAAYEVYILTKGLDMNYFRGRDLVSEQSKKTCAELSQIDVRMIEPTAVPQDKIPEMMSYYANRNEAIVNRDITLLIIPSIRLRYYCGASHLEHVVDEVNANWYSQCVLEGPQLRPDLAIGLLPSTFTKEEIEKLKRYTSVNNWTHVTPQMLFPFLMCEVKCGREGLDVADRQNMHSCSVAVRALLRIEQEADKYRQEKKKAESLSGQVLVFSISHDQQDARLYGHYAIVQGENWTYYRYRIRKFDLTDDNSLLAIHSFVRNILKSHLPEHVQRLRDALAALPDPNEPLESSGLLGSSTLSYTTSGMALNDNNSQQDSQGLDADGFAVPARPDGSQNGGAKKKGQGNWDTERFDELMHKKQEEKQRQEHKEEMERQRQEIEGLKQQEEKQKQEHKEEMERQRQEIEGLKQQISTLLALSKQRG